MPTRNLPEKFLVAFSFAGEQRGLVSSIAKAVEQRLGEGTVFYDEWFEFYIAGDDADIRLQDVYSNRSILVVPCLSERYGGKSWTRAEHKAIRALQLKLYGTSDERAAFRVLPLRVGDGDVRGIFENTICPDVRTKEIGEVVELIVDRLHLIDPSLTSSATVPPAGSLGTESEYLGQILFLEGSENCTLSSNAARIETHQAFFRDYSSEELLTTIGTRPSVGESWRVEAEWDASHKVPKRGDGQKINPPSLVAWSPKADCLFTACDAFGMSVWETSGRRYGEVFNESAYGYPRRFFIYQRGSSHRVLQETQSYRNRYYFLYGNGARLIGEGVNHDLWGWVNHEGFKGAYWKYGLDPWRPRSDGEIAFVHEYTGLKFVDVNKIGAESKSVKELLNETSAVHFLKFDSLGKVGSSIFSFHFHPSGEYVAVTTGDWDDKSQRRVHVVHIASAHVVARIPASARELGWSPGGRYLLFKKWKRSADGEQTEQLGAFDSHNFTARYELSDEWYSRLWVIRALGDEYDMAMSADGQRLLTRSGASVVSVTREASRLRTGEEVARIADRTFADAVWHPFDPHCFVTVGGTGSKEHPDMYERDHNMPQGRLLRIWRLVI